MQNADDEEALRRRLAEALDSVHPPYSTPRYLKARPGALAWRLAPAVLAVTALSALVLTAYAGTGSPNPVVWTEKFVNVVAPPLPSPAGETTKSPNQAPSSKPAPMPTHHESPEPSESPEPRQSPEPSDGHGSSPSPSPSPSDSGDGERS